MGLAEASAEVRWNQEAVTKQHTTRLTGARAQGARIPAGVPTPLFHPIDVAELRRPQGRRSGVNAIIGKWPGDEGDAEFAAAVKALS